MKKKLRKQNFLIRRLWSINKKRKRQDEGYILVAVIGLLVATLGDVAILLIWP